MIPSKIGSWSVVDQLGSGGQGFVIRGKKFQLDGSQLEAAIKIPVSDPTKLSEEGKRVVIQALIHEFEMLKLVDSPNVCRVVDSGIETIKRGQKSHDLPWLATELIKGDDLHTEIKKNGPLDESSWAQVSWDIANGLEAIHKVGATHLDLKPQNVVRHARRAIVIDLGGASFVGKFDMGDVIQARTLNYAAPEQLDQRHDPEDYEYPVDLYSLGAIMYFAATGKVLFDGDDGRGGKGAMSRRLTLMKTEKFDTSDLSAEQAQMISKLCRFKPADRISLEELKKCLLSLLPERDSIRRASSKDSGANFESASEPQSLSSQKPPRERVDLGGWIGTLLLSFFPPLIGPIIRYFQLRNSEPKTSERSQLRTLLVIGSLFSFGIVGALAFFHKSRQDNSLGSKIMAIVFGATSISFLLTTLVGINTEPESTIYAVTQVVASFGIAINIFLIAPLSGAIGIYQPKPKEPALGETTSMSIDEGNTGSTGADTQ